MTIRAPNSELADAASPEAIVRWAAIVYLVLQGAGAIAWWVVLWVWPASRTRFLASSAPDATLLAFAFPDLVLFAGASLLSAVGLAKRRSWAWPVLCIHSGAGVYAALYCVALAWHDAHASLGAIMMAPSLVALPLITIYFRPSAHSL